MAVKAAFIVAQYVAGAGDPVDLIVSGQSMDGAVNFTITGPGGISISGIDPASTTLKADIEAAVKAALEAAPYNMTFGSGDTVRLIP